MSLAVEVTHPLEPLTADEIQQTIDLLRQAEKVTPTTRFVSVTLVEPDKASVHAAGGVVELPRSAKAILFDNDTNSCFEAVVSLSQARVVSWRHIPGVQPTMTIDEQVECEQAVITSPEFQGAAQKALRHRRHPAGDGRHLDGRYLWRCRRGWAAGWPGRSALSAATRPTTAMPGRSRASGRWSI